MLPGVSIVICCHNSATRISETLKYLSEQQFSISIPWEVIVVNNASSDNTVEVAHTWGGKFGNSNFKIIDQTIPGLAAARQKGIEFSAYSLLIFCDDDNHLESNYVQEAYILMNQNPQVGVAGGWVQPKLPFYPGKWIEANYAALAIGRQSATSGYVNWVFGAGMIFRKKIFNELKDRGIKFMLTGRLGVKQTSGDDAEMCRLARFIGYKIYYSNKLILHHQISAHRLTRWSFIKANFMNVYHVIYFYLLDNLINHPDMSSRDMHFKFLHKASYSILYFLPRVFLGKNNFYSFMMLFQNLQLLAWLSLKRKHFSHAYKTIKTNLYHGNK